MYGEDIITRVLVSSEDITRRSRELGKELTEYYKAEPENLLLVGLLKGSIPFMAELIKWIELPIKIDFMDVSSYSGTESTGDIKINLDLHSSIRDKDVLLVEDIIDTGITIARVKEMLFQKGARDVRVVSLLNKPGRRQVEIEPDFYGFEIPNEFVVGFGLDYEQDYRNLPYVAVLKPEVYTK